MPLLIPPHRCLPICCTVSYHRGLSIAWLAGIALAATLGILNPAFATEPIDVAATLPTASGKLLVASVGEDEVACLSLLGPQVWFVLKPSTNALFVVNTGKDFLVEVTPRAILQWQEERASQKDALQGILAQVRSDPSISKEAKETIAKYSKITSVNISPLKGLVTPMANSVVVPELRSLNRRLALFRAELRKEISDAELASQQLACALEVDQLPSQLKSPTSSNNTTLTMEKHRDARPYQGWQKLRVVESLSSLFHDKRTLPLPPSVVNKNEYSR